MYHVTVLIVATLACPAHAVTRALLIGPDLQRHPAVIQSLDHGRISYFDQNRRMRVEPITHFVQLRIVQDDQEHAPSSERTDVTFDLANAQRLVGKWIGTDDAGQVLTVQHPKLGHVSVSLDELSAMTLGAPGHVDRHQARDVVLLANGDHVEGFVIAVRKSGIELDPGKTKPVRLPVDRIRALYLTSMARGGSIEQHLVRLHDGSAVFATELSIADDQLLFRPRLKSEEEVVEVSLKHVRRIDLASGPGRLIDLTELEHKVTAGGEVFGLPRPPRILADLIHLHAPITLSYELPAGTTHFAAVAELAVGSEVLENSKGWAEFQIIVRVDDRILARHRINAAQPQVSLSIPVYGQQLTIELDDDVNGPVLDRLLIRDAILFVKRGVD